jgi:hypothetical protein
LIGWEVVAIGFILEEITCKAKRGIVIHIGFQMRDLLDLLSNPCDK